MSHTLPRHRSLVRRDEDERVRKVELLISALLRAGVVTSLLAVVTGVLLSFLHHGSYLSSPAALQRLTRPGAAFPHTLRDIAAGLGELRGQAMIMTGLLLLIATPVLRVAVSILIFLHERDRRFVLITSLVLAFLLASFLLGKVTG